MKIVIVTGGFDPIHSGHIALLKEARSLGDELVVGLNSDDWLSRKKGRPFMSFHERQSVLQELRCVDRVLEFDDSDGSACNLIKYLLEHTRSDCELIFANGGDHTPDNIPEMQLKDSRLSFIFGIGGSDKANSSSWLLKDWKQPRTKRPWGNYRVLHELAPHVKVKELTVKPGASLSMQRHDHRQELWFVAQGHASVYGIDQNSANTAPIAELDPYEMLHIAQNEWHQLKNESTDPLKIIEIQFGEICTEEDIERKS